MNPEEKSLSRDSQARHWNTFPTETRSEVEGYALVKNAYYLFLMQYEQE